MFHRLRSGVQGIVVPGRARGVLAAGALVWAAVGLTGCATIFCGSHQTVNFSSEPSGAKIRIEDPKHVAIHDGTTPFNVSLKRGRGFFQAADLHMHVTVAGQPEREIPIKSELNGWYFANLLFGGLIGMLIVDPISGAMWSFPDPVKADFNAPAASPPAARTDPPVPEIRVMMLNDVPPQLREKLVRVN